VPRSAAGRDGDQAVIRRGFWLVTGAVLGVTGYRRATRLARAVTGQPPGSSASPAWPRLPGAIQLRWRSPLTLTTGAPAKAARPARPADALASAAGFGREMRQGMAEYWDLHRGDTDRTLGGQGTQMTSGGAYSSGSSAGWAFSGQGEDLRDRPEQSSGEQGFGEQGFDEQGLPEPGFGERDRSAQHHREP
jgi:hypothetical protein